MAHYLRQRGRIAAVALIVAAVVGACRRDVTEPSGAAAPDQPRAIGLVEVTFANIGAPNLTSSAVVASSVAELDAIHQARAHEAERAAALEVAPGGGAGQRKVVLGDINGDGRLDIAITNDVPRTVSILLGAP